MAIRCLSRLAITVLVATALGGSEIPWENGHLVVHEWGTFTSIAGRDGAALEWRPLGGPSDLPGFVYSAVIPGRAANCLDLRYSVKSNWRALVRMETPVLYFYAGRPTTVSVRVDFPQGSVTEWYPQARWVGAGIDWGSVEVLPGAAVDFPTEKGHNHYYAARQTDAAPIRVAGRGPEQHEKLLFYRGVGNFNLPLSARLEGHKIMVTNPGSVGAVVLFENRGGRVAYAIHPLPQREVALETPNVERTTAALDLELERLLTNHGLYEKEARAMIETWRDSWFEEGLRLFYVVPREVTEKILPITIEPKPALLVRVLVGRMEMITPEMEESVRHSVTRLGDPSPAVRHAAMEAIRKHGRFAEPILLRALERTENAGIKHRVGDLLGFVYSNER